MAGLSNLSKLDVLCCRGVIVRGLQFGFSAYGFGSGKDYDGDPRITYLRRAICRNLDCDIFPIPCQADGNR